MESILGLRVPGIGLRIEDMNFKRIVLFASILAAVFAQPHIASAQATRPVQVSWTASTSSGITGYSVYRGTSTTGPWTLLTASPITATSYTDAAVTTGATYTYQVIVVSAACTPTTPVTTVCGSSAATPTTTNVPPTPNAVVSVTTIVP